MRQLTISDGRASLHVSELCLGTMYFGYRTGEASPSSMRSWPRPN